MAWNVADMCFSTAAAAAEGKDDDGASFLEGGFEDAPWFYVGFLASLLAGAIVVGV